MNRWMIVPTFALLCSGCAFHLGQVQSQPGKTADQQTLDTLTCKDTARIAYYSSPAAAASFGLGMTIVGVPASIELEKSVKRQAFGKCMNERGYAIAQATD